MILSFNAFNNNLFFRKFVCFSDGNTLYIYNNLHPMLQRRIQNPIKHLRWNILQKHFTVLSR